MTDRERLIEILKLGSCPSPYLCDDNCKYANLERCYEERTADLLLEHGIIVLPCKVGDIVYVPYKDSQTIEEKRVMLTSIETDEIETCMKFYCKRDYVFLGTDINREVFLTREEAEQALKGSDGS